MRISLFICTLLFAVIDTSVSGFVTKSTVQNSLGLATSINRSNNAPHLPTSASFKRQQQQQQVALTVQHMASKGKYDFGSERGYVIQVIVVAICVWSFSIPPEFRRARFCPNPTCVENRASCNDCVTFSEWKIGVSDYYKGGGGVNFDFSIDPATKEANKEMMDKVLKR
jgi:hypothetical protein